MGTTIFYFTGTGNSLMVARDLAKEIEGTRLVSIAQAIKETEILISDDCIGFIFPTYNASFPLIVRDFIKRLSLDSSIYIFTVCTLGAEIIDASLILEPFSKLIAEQGGKLALGRKIPLPTNHIETKNPPDSSKQEKMFQSEKQKIKEIAKIIKSRQLKGVERNYSRILFKLIKPIAFRIVGVETYSKRLEKYNNAAKKFYTNDRCVHCGICKLVCPVNNIELVKKSPNWLDHCQQCMACIEWCPQKAIEIGKHTASKKRYTNPTVTVKDIINSAGKAD